MSSFTEWFGTYWLIILIATLIALDCLWKYLKKFKKKENNEQTVIVKKIKDLDIPEQIKLLQKEQEAVQKELRKLEIKKQKLLKIARVNTIQYESLKKIKMLK